jgi:hypothetical protein
MKAMSNLKIVEGSGALSDYPIEAGERLESHYFITFHFDRWLNSDFRMKASAEVRAYAFDLFCLAQKQSPFGTLPDDDEILSKLLMIDLATWQDLRMRNVSPLYHWEPCRCGDKTRLMHPVVLEMAQSALVRKRADAKIKSNDRERKQLFALEKQIIGAGLPAHMAENAAFVDRLNTFLNKHCSKSRTPSRICEAVDALELIDQAKGSV